MTTVIVTRPVTAIEQSSQIYKEAGFDVFQAPSYDIQTNESVQPQWLNSAADTWIILSVHALTHALKLEPKLNPSTHTNIIAVGPAVKNLWQQHFNHPIRFHPSMNSEGVIELLKIIKPQSVKILTAENGRNLIKSYCMQAQISYSQINTYLRIPLKIDVEKLTTLYRDKTESPTILTATSGNVLQHFYSQLTQPLQHQVKFKPLIVGAQRIAQLATSLGFTQVYVANSPSDECMCMQVANYMQTH